MWIALTLLACTKDEPIEEVFTGCDPVDTTRCALPFPSTYHMVQDDTQASGWRVNFADHALPMDQDGGQVLPDHWNLKDGFTTLGPVLAYFAELDPSNLPGHQDLDASLAGDSPIVLIHAETGERVPFFAELDATADYDDERMLIIRPVVPMEHATRYVVGIRDLSKTDGSPVDVSESFAALRDGTETDTWDTEGRRDWYDTSIFPALESAGMDRAELQLAWDFVTVSEENSLGQVLHMRDDAAERVGDGGPAYTVTSVEDHDCSGGGTIGRTIEVDLTVPMYVQDERAPTLLNRGEDGMPEYNGDTTAELLVRIPCSLIEDPEPAMVLQYGHGLLGDKGEARTGYLSEMADRYKWVIIASDWVGMYEDDVGPITEMLVFDVGGFAMLPERSMQGFVQMDLALRAVRGDFASDDSVTFDGVQVIDPTRVGYYGNSQGAILGGGYVGMSDQIDRAVLGVGGAPYSILLSRSADFDPFFLVFKSKFPDQRDIAILLTAMQTLWDPAEAAGWLHQMNDAPIGGNPPKDVLLQVAVGDSQVTTLGAHIMARGYGATTIAPETRPVWGVEEQTAPFSGSALVEWYYSDGSTEPVENVPPDHDGDTHECPRRELAAQDQLHDFLVDGVVNQYCDGACEGTREGFCD
jgi:hypothetical protein